MTNLSQKLQQRAEAGIQGRTPIQTIGEYLRSRQGDIARALPRHMDPDRLLRITMTLIEANPRLTECSTASIVGGVLQAAQLGLEPGLLGECYLVPYWNSKKNALEAQFQVGYRGYAKLALQSGAYQTFEAHVVYEKDGFDYALGTAKHLTHKPYLGADRGQPIAAYAIVETKDGATQFEIMSLADIEKVRKASKAADDGPWVAWWAEMARKTAAKRLAKYLQLSPQLSRAIAADETTKTEISEDMANVVDATDWTVSDPVAQDPSSTDPGASQEAQPHGGRPQAVAQDATITTSGPRGSGKPASDRQRNLIWARAKAAFGSAYEAMLKDYLAAHGLPPVSELTSAQASRLIDDLSEPGSIQHPKTPHTPETPQAAPAAPAEGDSLEALFAGEEAAPF